MRIKTAKAITCNFGQHSFTARPDMGVIKHFPTQVCKALIKMGATEVRAEKSSKEVKAGSAE